ncbi:MAG: hypothetical protein K9W44_15830 [Candidatus Lokiarchaeota archaeon]|nr:hypothetical protein [Candidatus Harpocratesius repetitus]
MSFFTLMHLSFHYAIGIIFTSLISLFVPLVWWQYGVIVFFSVISDFDIVYLIWSSQKNHRMFFTHSIYFSILVLLIGFAFAKFWIIACGIVAILHVGADLFDWGTNLFFSGHIIGPRLLLARDELDRVPELMAQEVDHKWFFVKRYFNSFWCQFAEILAGVSMILSITLITPDFWYFIFGYILALGYHLFEFFELRYRSIHNRARFQLVNH